MEDRMGFRFGVKQANVVAHLLEPSDAQASLTTRSALRVEPAAEAVIAFAEQLQSRYMSTAAGEERFRSVAAQLREAAHSQDIHRLQEGVLRLKHLFGGRP